MFAMLASGTELRRFSKGIMPRIAVVILLFIPLLYGALYLWAFWNPTNNMNNLPVALVNEDTGATQSDGTVITAGDDVVTQLLDGNDLKWTETDAASAAAGVQDGTYYFSVTIPADFSQSIVSPATTSPESAKIDVSYNDANSFLATTLGKTAMLTLRDAVADNVSSTQVNTILVGLNQASSGFSSAAAGTAELADGTSSAESGSSEITVGLQSLADGLNSLNSGTATLADGLAQLSSGASTLSSGVTSAASGASTLSSGSSELSSGAASLSSGASTLATGTSTLATGTSTLSSGASTLASGLSTLNTAVNGTGGLATGVSTLDGGLSELQKAVSGTGGLADSVSALNTGGSTLSAGASTVSSGAASVASGASTVSSGAASVDTGVTELAQEVDAAKAALESGNTAEAKLILEQITASGSLVDQVSSGASSVASGASSLASGASSVASGASTLASGASSVASGASSVASGASTLSTGLTSLNTAITKSGGLTDSVAALASGATTLDTGVNGTGGLAESVTQLSAGGSSVASGASTVASGTSALSSGASSLSAGASTLASGASSATAGVATLSSGLDQLASGASTLNSSLATAASGASTLASGTSSALTGATTLETGSSTLTTGLSTINNGLGTLQTSLASGATQTDQGSASDVDAKASVVASPVTLNQTWTNQASSWGEGFAPFFIALALFVGGIITWLLLHALPRRAIAAGVSGMRAALSGFLPAAVFGVGQVIIMMGVLILGLGLSPNYLVGTLLFVLLTALTFLALQQMFIITMGSAAGRVVALALLMLQLSSSGGTYPVETTPEFFQAIHPWMPISYVVTGLRQLLTGQLDEQLWISVLVLLGIMIGSLLISAFAAGRQRMWTMARLHPEIEL